MGENWIYVVLLLAYYVWSYYSSQKKKREEQSNKKQGTAQPRRHHNPTPASGNIPKPFGDIFKEIFGEEILPKPVVKQHSQKEVREPLKKIKSPAPVFTEGGSSINMEMEEALQQKEIELPQQEKIAFNAREAFIGSVIWNRPEY